MGVPTYTTTGKGKAIAVWGAVGLAAGTFAASLAAWGGAPAEVTGPLAAFVAVLVPPLVGRFLSDDA